MRSSSIAQGLKSWASKLHPQLPLTNTESSRLLNALTSAFREKLDEAHPRNTLDGSRTRGSSNATTKSASVFHSSAAHADKHLENVLTNPLLGGRLLDYGTAKVELARDPYRDPVELLEEYHEKGAASVAIAELCLNQVRQSIERLPENQQEAAFHKSDAGRRVLKWLLQSSLRDSKDYADKLLFMDNLVSSLYREGREQDIWSWVKLDIKSDDVPQSTTGRKADTAKKIALYQYRWRGRVLYSLLKTKAALTDQTDPESVNAAFDTMFEICRLKESADSSEHHLNAIPMAPAATYFGKLFGKPHAVRTDLDVARFEKYIDLLPTVLTGSSLFTVDLERAKMQLMHPKGRRPAEAFKWFERLFSKDPPVAAWAYLRIIKSSGGSAVVHKLWSIATATIYALRQQGLNEDAAWLRSRCAEEFTRQEPHFQAKMDEIRRYDMHREAHLHHNGVTESPAITPVLTTFA